VISTERRIVYMFSGLGAQHHRMGYELYCRNASFRKHVDALNTLIVDATGLSPAAVFLESPRAEFLDDSVLSGLSIYVIERAMTRLLLENDVHPDCILSSSMGMFAAGVLAGAYDEEEGIRWLHDVMTAFDDRCVQGNMIAVLGSSSRYRERGPLRGATELAGVSYDVSYVLALCADRLGEVEACLRAEGSIYQVLPVSRPYHSRWIEPAKADVVNLATAVGRAIPSIPFWCCSAPERIEVIDAAQTWRTVRKMMDIEATIADIERGGPCIYLDVGPSGDLATIAQRGLRERSQSMALPILTQFKTDSANFVRAVSHARALRGDPAATSSHTRA
jgi:acyl transferase domain-containing protein